MFTKKEIQQLIDCVNNKINDLEDEPTYVIGRLASDNKNKIQELQSLIKKLESSPILCINPPHGKIHTCPCIDCTTWLTEQHEACL